MIVKETLLDDHSPGCYKKEDQCLKVSMFRLLLV